MVNRAHSILLGVLFLWVPLAFFSRSSDGFTLPKEIAASLALVLLLSLSPAGPRRAAGTWLVRCAWIFFAWMFLDALAVGPLRMEALKGSVHLFLMAGALTAVTAACSRDQSYERLLRFALAAGGIMAVYGVIQALGLERTDWTTRFDRRAFSTLGNPDYLGGHLAALIPPALILTLRSTDRTSWLWYRALTLFMFVGLLMTRARGAELALAAAMAFMALAFLSPWGRDLAKRNSRFLVASFGIALVVGAGYIARHGGWETFSFSQASVRQRTETWQVAREMIKSAPWTGIGLGHVGFQYPRFQFRPYEASEFPDHPYTLTEHIHNEYLQFWVEGGLPGLLLFLAMLAAFALALLRTLRDPETTGDRKELLLGVSGGMVALLVQSVSNFPLQVAPTVLLFGLFLAGPLVLGPRPIVTADKKEGPWAVPAALSLAVMVLGAHAMASSIAYRNTLGETLLGKADNAVYYGKRLTGLSPWNPKAWSAYAKALALAKKDDQALAAYGKADELDPNDVQNAVAMAQALAGQGRFADAVEVCKRAEAMTPNYPGAFWVEAACLYRLQRFGEAAEEYRKLLGYVPNNAEVYTNLGVCEVQSGRKDEAVGSWKKALALDPNDAQVKRYLQMNGVKK